MITLQAEVGHLQTDASQIDNVGVVEDVKHSRLLSDLLEDILHLLIRVNLGRFDGDDLILPQSPEDFAESSSSNEVLKVKKFSSNVNAIGWQLS